MFPTHRSRPLLFAVACLTGALVAGCSSAGSTPGASPSTSAGSDTAAGSTDTGSPGPSPSATGADGSGQSPTGAGASTSPTEAPPSATAEISGPSSTAAASGTGAPAGPGAAVVQAIRMADHGSFDRVVVEFSGTFGSWDVAYVPKVISDPEGKVVALAGSAYLAVRVQKATFDNQFQVDAGIPHLTYTGPRRMTAGLAGVKEIAEAGDFEAVLGLGIGVAKKSGIRAYRLSDPSRLVIDIAH